MRRATRADVLYCPRCDCPSESCGQPEGYVSYGADEAHPSIQWVHGHAGEWVTDAERRRDEANDVAKDLPSEGVK